MTAGATNAALPNFFNASGPVLSLLANTDPNFDFTNFANGKGMINLTFTATSFTGTTSFAGLFATPGAVVVGNGSFSQIAVLVPEPSALAQFSAGLAGVGLVCLVRRKGPKPC